MGNSVGPTSRAGYSIDGERDEQGPLVQQFAISRPATITTRPPARIAALRLRHIYGALMAADFRMPRVFDDAAGELARHAHLFRAIPAAERPAAIGAAVSRIWHTSLPPELSDTAYRIAMSAFPFGPSKKFCGRSMCACGRSAEVVHHTFHECVRSRRAWEIVLERWRRITGETRLRADDGRLVLFGDRSATWATEAEQSAFAGLEPPFATIHKTTQHVLLEERDRDAAPRPRLRRTAAQVLQLVERRVQRIVTLRWQAALEARPRDGGAKRRSFEKE